MLQTVYVLELVRPGGTIRGHFAQTLGAAQRAAGGKYHLTGRWEAVQGDGVSARLLGPDGRELARVVRERLEYG